MVFPPVRYSDYHILCPNKNSTSFAQACWVMTKTTLANFRCKQSLSAETTPLRFVGSFDLISIIYGNIQNPLCNFVLIMHTKFHQNET